jgi:hypothetical protein
MTAYVIVDIDVTDPVLYDEYKKLPLGQLQLTAAGTWHAAARQKRWKVNGRPLAW